MPAGLGSPAPTAWHRLDPLTKLVTVSATTFAAILLDGPLCLVLLALVAVLLPAASARVAGRVTKAALILALPVALSAAVVNILFSTGTGAPIVGLGPFTITGQGVMLAVVVVTRVICMAGAVALFYLTTRPAELVASLQWHGAGGRATFVIHSGISMLPRLADRAAEVTAAQRARGLDTEGSPWRRARGVLAVAAPTVLGVVAETETRTLALETRGFTRPGPRTLLWVPWDSPRQRLARWGMLASLGLLGVLRLSGTALPC